MKCVRERVKNETEVEFCGKRKSDVAGFGEGKKFSLSFSF
jgi:hypothetical protein